MGDGGPGQCHQDRAERYTHIVFGHRNADNIHNHRLVGWLAGQTWWAGLNAYTGGWAGTATDAGSVTSYNCCSGAQPEGIAIGADGNIYTSSWGYGNDLAEISSSGSVINDSFLGGTYYLAGIVPGPDGNIWYADYYGSIAQLNISTGAVQEFSGASYPLELTVGQDGNIWFTGDRVDGTGSYGKIDMDGDITTYTMPTGIACVGITAAPDGYLYAACQTGVALARIGYDGTIAIKTLASPWENAYGITALPDGQVWFSDPSGDAVGTFRVSSSPCAPSPTPTP